MPYKAKGKCVYKKGTNDKVGCTRGSVKKYLAALHTNVDESKEEGKTMKVTKEQLKQLVKEEIAKLLKKGKK